ncbi:ATP-dependent DNA helicase [Robiginitomaculum antarcticum]|uniref:ATP-dependent DNA helicase n=1 Tax=Robiginitomaculum antarcticum TaxID=437507 RepID=UPI000371B82D|nr:DEAD/DEAH box helicase [Robiginitomaculum antarcticum]
MAWAFCEQFGSGPIAITDTIEKPKSIGRLSEEAKDVLRQLLSDDRAPILLSGKAGTGKSTLIRYIQRQDAFPNTVVLAPTGIAALNIGGQTLHSFFRLPPRILTDAALQGQKPNGMWRKVDLIIVDEVSMTRVDVIDAMDKILKKARKNTEPFGGCRMLFVGDFYQLPPVAPRGEAQMLHQMGYETPFAYSAHVFREQPMAVYSLSQVYRQNEPEFLDILSDLRGGEDVEYALERLNTRCAGPHRDGVTPLLLTGTNATAARYNQEGLERIDAPSQNFEGRTKGKFNVNADRLGAPPLLQLKIGARVMALKNDMKRRWVNGSIGTVKAMEPGKVTVEFDNGKTGQIEPDDWDTIRYSWDEAAGVPKAEVIGSYSQIPLSLAWAVTIHKAQGLTLDDVRVDLERGAFAAGQAYVALSRSRTLDGLSLTRPLGPRDIMVDDRHADELARLSR